MKFRIFRYDGSNDDGHNGGNNDEISDDNYHGNGDNYRGNGDGNYCGNGDNNGDSNGNSNGDCEGDSKGDCNYGGQAHYDEFEVPHEPGQTVLDALFYIQENLDDSLSFRYSCRGAVCGSCAMLINKVPRLACRTQVKPLLEGEDNAEIKHYPALDEGEEVSDDSLLVEPLPHLPVVKDLIVDEEKFFEYYRDMEPFLRIESEVPEKEYRMSPEEVNQLEDYTNCILCAACFGACPVDGENEKFRGPAALAKLYRFHIDSRDEKDRLEIADHEDGWWACEFHTNCQKVCPKDVPPNKAIGKARAELQQRD